MKSKILALAALFAFATTAIADPNRNHHGYEHDRDHHEWHDRGGHFGWGEFVGGIVLGGILAHEVSGRYYDNDEQEVRQICNDYPVVDQYGRYVFDNMGHLIVERRCRWVQVTRYGPWP